jgi:CubicO group peptidase (beta-lactamase class C family)
MSSSNTTVTALQGRENVAAPHARVDGQVRTVPWRNIDNAGPAGSINSNAADMARWVGLHLGGGSTGGKRLLKPETVKEMQTPNVVIRLEPSQEKLNPETHFMSYGLGWTLQDYRGRKVVVHGGNIDGMSALVAMMPEENVGLVILANMGGSPLPGAIMYRVFDAQLRAPPRDWSAEMLRTHRASAGKPKEPERATGTSPSLSPAKYAGTYTSDLYGEMRVVEDGGKLVMRYGPTIAFDLEHWHHDTFRAHFRDPMRSRTFVTFTLNAQGKVDELKTEHMSAFKRAPDGPVPAGRQ